MCRLTNVDESMSFNPVENCTYQLLLFYL